MDAIKSGFETVESFYFKARELVSFQNLLGANKAASVAMLSLLVQANNDQGVFHLQALRAAGSVVVSSVVPGVLKSVRVYRLSGQTGYQTTVSATDRSMFSFLFQVAASILDPSRPSQSALYAPPLDMSSKLGVVIQDLTFLTLKAVGVAGATVRVVQTSTNSGIMYLLRGPILLSALFVPQANSQTIVEADLTETGLIESLPSLDPITGVDLYKLPDPQPVFPYQNLIELFTLANTVGRTILDRNSFGPVFDTREQMTEYLKETLDSTQYENFLANLEISDEVAEGRQTFEEKLRNPGDANLF